MEIKGRVVFANGAAAQRVQVRVFDQDAPGKQDDDLTTAPGLSNAQGLFTVHFDPARFLDFTNIPFLGLGRGVPVPDVTDLYLPYLCFTYEVDGQAASHQAALTPFQSEYMLPDAQPLHFVPSVNGFQFPNRFPGYPLPFSIPFLPNGASVSSVYGLCGGMSSAAADLFLANRGVPAASEPPNRGTRLHRYLFRRAADTFDLGRSIARFAEWMALPEEGAVGTQRRTAQAFEAVRQRLGEKQLVVLGLVYDQGRSLSEVTQRVWNNHQVLGYAYQSHSDGSFDVQIYDPNFPHADHMSLHLDAVTLDGTGLQGLRTVEMQAGQLVRPVRGFFAMPYEPILPPEKL